MAALSGNIGTDGNDTLQGTSAGDLLQGLAGNDSISGLSGNDTLFGDAGDDTIRGGSGNDSIAGGDGADRIIDTTGSNVIDGGAGNDFINAGDHSQTVHGGDGNDEIHVLVFAPGGTTIVDGGDGNDTLDGYVFDDGPVLVTGGAGVDLFDFQAVSNVPGNVVITDFTAGAGGDVFDLANILYDMSGYDGGNPFAEGLVRVIQGDHKAELQVQSGGVFQTVIDLANVDVSALTAENFRGFTFDGAHLAGQAINGTDNGDTLLGTIGDDTMNGLAGDDSLFGDNGADLIDGGDGNDTLNGYLGLNTLIGGTGDDSLVSVDGANTLYGGDGADVLDISGNARQFADGGNGNDTFSGGLNSYQTTLTGGSGADTYHFNWVNSGAYATITDFTAGSGGDVVLLDDLIDGQLSGDVGNPFTDGYMRLVQSGSDVLFQVDADGASSPFASFETYFFFQNTVLEQFTAYNFGGYAPFPSPVPKFGNDSITGTAGGDLIVALAGDDTLRGLGGNDTLDGGTGADAMFGGAGNDVYYVDSANDAVSENTMPGIDDGGTDEVLSSISYVLPDFVENLSLQNKGYVAGPNDAISGTGNSLDNVVHANDGGDTLSGLGGNDTLIGGYGADTLLSGEGNDFIQDQFNLDRLHDSESVLPVTGGGFNLAHGGDGNDRIEIVGFAFGDAGDDTISLQAIADYEFSEPSQAAYGGDGSDIITASADFGSSYTLDGGTGNDTISGGQEQDYITGGAGNDLISAGDGFNAFDSVIFSGLLANYVISQTGNTWVVQDTVGGDGADTLTGIEYAVFSDQTVQFHKVIQLSQDSPGYQSAQFGNTILGSAGNDYIYDIEGPAPDSIDGGSGDDTISASGMRTTVGGGAGMDRIVASGIIYGDDGNDSIEGYAYVGQGVTHATYVAAGDGNDYINLLANSEPDLPMTAMGGAGSDTIWGSDFRDILSGDADNDVIYGQAGNDTLDGGAGADTLYGGAGSDVYYVDTIGDLVVEASAADGGADRVFASVSYTLGNFIENLNLTGSFNLDGTGNGLNNGINGNSGSNHLWGLGGSDVMNGGAGADTMYGGSGDDTYIVDNAGDVASEESAGTGLNDGGTDTVQASVSYALGGFIEDLTLTGTANIDGTGNGLNNVITGNAGANALWGLDGSDRLNGNGGSDTLHGGAGNDTLIGGEGIDTLYGGANNDTYYVDNTGDVASEQSTAGVDDGGTEDRVYASVSYTIDSFFEQLYLTGVANLSGTGNGGDNTITGNAGNNLLSGMGGADSLLGGDGLDTLYGGQGNDTLDGGTGADTMYGGAGNDIYYVDSASDVVLEESTGPGINDGGGDRVMSSVDFTLGNFVEHLNLSGAANLNGTGNGLANGLNGNSGNNSLSGLGGVDTLNGANGDDTLAGGQGNDVLNGGVGADTFVFAAAGIANGVDTVQDFVHGTDALLFTGADYGFTAGHVLTASEFTSGSAAVGSSAQFVWDAATHTLYWDHDGAGGDAAIAIATFNGAATVTASDVHFG